MCFRHVPAGVPAATLDELQSFIRRELIASGKFYISQTRLAAGLYMRVTLINPSTQDSDLQALLEEVRSTAAKSARDP